MVLLSVKMVKTSLVSFTTNDMELAGWTIKTDPLISEFSQKLLKKAASKAKEIDDKKSILMSFINIREMISNIERIADHSTNIAEAAIYACEGKDIRHHKLTEPEDESKYHNHE
jgi:phosphate transport system protein